MSIIINNYETIVKTIVSEIRNGNIISKNSEQLETYSIKELFNLFTQEFNLVHYKNKIITGLTIVDNILRIPILDKPVYIDSIYFAGLGEIEIIDGLVNDIGIDNALYFDLDLVNIDQKWISINSVITINYVGFNLEMQ